MNKKEVKKAPALRFKGFTNDWEQRKLNSFLVEYKKKTKINNQYPVLTSSRQGIFFQKDYYDGNQIASKNNVGYNIVPRDYFTYRHMSDDTIFHFNINTLCDYGIVSTLYPVFTTINQLSSSWLYYYLNYGNDMKRYALLQKQGGSRTYMYFSKLKNMLAHIPSVKEQDSIAKILLKIDKLITLQQRKLDILIKLNRNIIINLFKEIRVNHHAIELKHTASNWKSARLKELGICQSGFGFPIKEQNGSKGIPFFKVSDFNTFGNEIYLQYANNYVTNHQIRKNKWKIFDQVPAIVFAKVGAAIFLNRKRMINEPFLIDNNLMAFELNLQKLDYKFAKILFDNMYLPKFAQVGALPSYNASDINAIKVKIPDMDSQKKIANIIMKNNNEIILQKQILQKGKELKQFLLQNMFI